MSNTQHSAFAEQFVRSVADTLAPYGADTVLDGTMRAQDAATHMTAEQLKAAHENLTTDLNTRAEQVIVDFPIRTAGKPEYNEAGELLGHWDGPNSFCVHMEEYPEPKQEQETVSALNLDQI